MQRIILALMIGFACTGGASAQTMLDLVPRDAAIAVATRNLDELIARGDTLLTETNVQIPFRPSQLFDLGAMFLGVNRGLDRKRAAAIVLLSPEKGRKVADFAWLEDHLVPILPFTDADAMAGNFGIAKGTFTGKEIHRTNRNDFVSRHAVRIKDHILLSSSDKTLRRMQQSKSVGESYTPEQRKRLDEGDLLIHIGNYLWTLDEGRSIADAVAAKFTPGDDPQEKVFADLFAKSLKEVDSAAIGARIKDGVDGHFLLSVPKDSQAALLLSLLRKQKKSSSLEGLPEGNVLFAQAASGDSTHEKLMTKALVNFLLEDFLVQYKLASHVDRLQYLGIFHEVWSRLKGNRLAIYQNANEPRDGLFSAIAIFDLDDPAAFLGEMRTLARMATADALDWTKQQTKEEIDIAKLVRSLGSAAFAVRQSANTKLSLIGEPALPYLQKAIDSKELDLETLRRCQTLRQRIGDVAAERRKELLRDSKTPLFLRPKLTYVAGAEKRQDQTVDVVHIKTTLSEKAAAMQAAEYKQLLGPDWDKVRVAVVGKQIVVMLGSDIALFDEAVRNVRKQAPGLAASKRLAPFYEQSAASRMFEIHVSMEGILRLTTPMARLDTRLQITSASLSLGPQSAQVDVRIPTAEIRTIARKVQDGIK